MNRGVLVLSRDELLELLEVYDISVNPEIPLSVKLNASLKSISDVNNISVSAEELEILLDEIGIVGDDRPLLKNVINKINAMILQWRV